MNGSWNLGTIAGVRVRIHWTFLILPVWIYFSALFAGSGLAVALNSVVFVLAIFGCVLLHELGHALAARRYGIATRDITLLPIGGVASLQRMPRNPVQELVITVAGPLVNAVIAAVIFGGLAWLAPLDAVSGSSLGVFLQRLAFVNVLLVVFNLIPAFPMDGGRILRSLLAMLMDYRRATSIAANVGQVCAVGLGLLGIFSGNLILLLIAAFVFLAAQGEKMAVVSANAMALHDDFQDEFQDEFQEVRPFADGTRVTVPASWPANSVARWLSQGDDDVCNVVQEGRVIGFLTKSDLLRALASGKGHWPIGQLLPVRY